MVVKSMTMFTSCGLRDFLQNELAKCPRSETQVVEMLKRRLGRHYEFQSAQRLAMGRIEEQCRRSGGDEWPESLALTRALAGHVALLLPWLACARPPQPKVYEDRQDGPEEDDSPDCMVPASSLAPESRRQGCTAPICRPRSAAKGTVC